MYFRNAPTPITEISEGGLPTSFEKKPHNKKRHSMECRSSFNYRSAIATSAIPSATTTAIAASVASAGTASVVASIAAVAVAP